MRSFRPETPADGPAWLPRFASSVADLFRRILPAPLKLFRAATADLPPAAGQEGALAWDTTAGRLTHSDGSDWIQLAAFDHAHAAADLTFTPAGNVAATDVQGAIEELDGEKAPLASPAFTGSLSAEGGAFSNSLSVTTAGATALFTLVGSGDRGVISGVKSDLTSYAPLSINALTEIRLGIAASGFSAATTAVVTAAAINLASGKVLQVNGTNVVGARGSAIADDASGAANQAKVNAILSALRTHGLIAP